MDDEQERTGIKTEKPGPEVIDCSDGCSWWFICGIKVGQYPVGEPASQARSFPARFDGKLSLLPAQPAIENFQPARRIERGRFPTLPLFGQALRFDLVEQLARGDGFFDDAAGFNEHFVKLLHLFQRAQWAMTGNDFRVGWDLFHRLFDVADEAAHVTPSCQVNVRKAAREKRVAHV